MEMCRTRLLLHAVVRTRSNIARRVTILPSLNRVGLNGGAAGLRWVWVRRYRVHLARRGGSYEYSTRCV